MVFLVNRLDITLRELNIHGSTDSSTVSVTSSGTINIAAIEGGVDPVLGIGSPKTSEIHISIVETNELASRDIEREPLSTTISASRIQKHILGSGILEEVLLHTGTGSRERVVLTSSNIANHDSLGRRVLDIGTDLIATNQPTVIETEPRAEASRCTTTSSIIDIIEIGKAEMMLTVGSSSGIHGVVITPAELNIGSRGDNGSETRGAARIAARLAGQTTRAIRDTTARRNSRTATI